MNRSKKGIRHSAVPFKATRQTHLLEAAEDYTELIAKLIAESGEARTGQIASVLGVSHVTVVRTLRRLEREGFVKVGVHKPVILTPLGKRTAIRCQERHDTLLNFLLKLGVPKRIAEIDVEGIEHHVSGETLRVIKRFLRHSC